MLVTTINSVMARGVRFLLGFGVHLFLRKTGPGLPFLVIAVLYTRYEV